MREAGAVKVYGSGLLSSYGEIEHAVTSPLVQRYPIQLEWVINQGFEINHYQPLLFIVDSFEHLFGLVHELEQWMKSGRLDNVAPGEPIVNEADCASISSLGLIGCNCRPNVRLAPYQIGRRREADLCCGAHAPPCKKV